MKIDDMKKALVELSGKLCDMVDLVSRGLMEHRPEFLTDALKTEDAINAMEKSVTKAVLEESALAKSEKDRKALAAIQQAVETLERMGDEASNLVERIEIKNAEHLLFSDLGLKQFNETYDTMRSSVRMMRDLLNGKEPLAKDRIVENGFRVKELVERYRAEHTDRLVRGICTPMAANMYFDMLDFTGNIARHASNVAKLF